MPDVACEETIMSLEKFTAGTIIAIIGAAIILTVTTAGLLSVNQTVPSSGIVTTVNVGVYQEYACTNNLTSIDWGTLSPGGSATRTIYVKNIGTQPITITMTKVNWNPASANGPITLSWSPNDTTLNAGQVATATLTLDVSASVSGITDFSFDIVITGTE
jgi:archaellum component FlaG (FlaF/FlaG flagellin family)